MSLKQKVISMLGFRGVAKSTVVPFLMAISMFIVLWFLYVFFFGDLRFIVGRPKDHWLVIFSKHIGILWFFIPTLIKFGLIVPMVIAFFYANSIFKVGNIKVLIPSSLLLIIIFYVSSVGIELLCVNFLGKNLPLSFDHSRFKEFMIRLHSYDIPIFTVIGIVGAFIKFKVKCFFDKG